MNRRLRWAAIAAGVTWLVGANGANAQLRVATWNLSNYTGSDRATAIQTAVYAQFSGRSMSPDVIAVQEFIGAGALSTFVGVLNTAPGSPGDWAAAPYFDDPNYVDTESALVYRTSRVQLVNSVVVADADGTTADQPRSTYRYDLRPIGYGPAASNHVAIYSVHLKAGSATADNDRRLIETTRIRDNAQGLDTNPNNGINDALPAGYTFMVAGDMNVQNASQTAYVELVGSQANNAGRFFDPIHCGNNSTASNDNGIWNNDADYVTIHTQDPSGPGGMDDRHDQILVSGSLVDNAGLDYIGNANLRYSISTWNDPNHSYRCWGNDGTSFNLALTTTGNTMVGPTIAQALKDCATTGGGHLPVFLDLRVPAKVGASTLTINFGAVTLGSTPPTQSISISNTGDTALWNAAGIANLSYTLAATFGFAAPGGSFADAAGGAGNSHTLSMSTSTLGHKTGTLTIASNDPDQPSLVVNLVGDVIPANQPPVANAGPDITITDADGSGAELVTLDGSRSTDDAGITLYRWSEGPTTLASVATPTTAVSLPVGLHTITLRVTDAGGLFSDDTLLVEVLPAPPACDPDINADGNVDQDDIDYLVNVVGGGPNPSGADPDFNHDGNVDQDDVDALINVVAGGPCP